MLVLSRLTRVEFSASIESLASSADKAMNWVGGTQTTDAAQQILSQGGIPNVGLTSGGVVKTIRIEHVWVEAYVNYNPSRGAVPGPGDTWVPLDPSYKQYAFAEGMDIKGNVAFDAQSFLDAAQQGRRSIRRKDGCKISTRPISRVDSMLTKRRSKSSLKAEAMDGELTLYLSTFRGKHLLA